MTDLNSKIVAGAQPQFDAESEQNDFDPTTSLGASINESMMMPPQALAPGLPDMPDFREAAALGDYYGSQETEEEGMWQKQVKAVDQSIRQNPYAYIAGALGLGIILGKSLTASSRKSRSLI